MRICSLLVSISFHSRFRLGFQLHTQQVVVTRMNKLCSSRARYINPLGLSISLISSITRVSHEWRTTPSSRLTQTVYHTGQSFPNQLIIPIYRSILHRLFLYPINLCPIIEAKLSERTLVLFWVCH
ncbi:hypothetical protein FB446DRAFT_315740 [Lentinula raphanica]|nr:hypothetical protein FB446DRAFT_315740 [Lentinula raphanica]